jgi:hypothetical protein
LAAVPQRGRHQQRNDQATGDEIAERNLSNAVDAGMGEQDWSAIHELARKKARLD